MHFDLLLSLRKRCICQSNIIMQKWSSGDSLAYAKHREEIVARSVPVSASRAYNIFSGKNRKKQHPNWLARHRGKIVFS